MQDDDDEVTYFDISPDDAVSDSIYKTFVDLLKKTYNYLNFELISKKGIFIFDCMMLE